MMIYYNSLQAEKQVIFFLIYLATHSYRDIILYNVHTKVMIYTKNIQYYYCVLILQVAFFLIFYFDMLRSTYLNFYNKIIIA